MEEKLDVDLGAFPFDVHLDSLVRGTNNLSFDQYTLSVDLSSTHSFENIALNQFVPKNMDTEIASVSDTKIDTCTMRPYIHCTLIYSLKLIECCSVIIFLGMRECVGGSH